ncbi:hypothetical protein OF83DRAFT_1168320 [Amylostereum chailletii]|nr:hypothetical protein OF83DRAFT_1168320 [Amylostereum chailletii]
MYGAAKAALKIYGDTLRLELAPFGWALRRFVDGDLDIDAAPAYLQYSSVATTHTGNGRRARTSLEDFAKVVVQDAFGSHPTVWLWASKTATFVWFMATFIPRMLVNLIVTRIFGLDKLAVHYRKSKKTA